MVPRKNILYGISKKKSDDSLPINLLRHLNYKITQLEVKSNLKLCVKMCVKIDNTLINGLC